MFNERVANSSSPAPSSPAPSSPAPSSKDQVILHPVLCAVYPVIFLYSANKQTIELSALVVPTVIMVAVALSLWAALTRLFGSSKMGAVYTSMPLLALFSYGAVEQAFRPSGGTTWTLIITACVVAVLLGALSLLKWRQHVDRASYVFNIVSLILVAAPLFQIALSGLGRLSVERPTPNAEALAAPPLSREAAANAPDIYYMMLDGYGRADVFLSDYDFDNRPFLEDLEKRGFYVADQAVSNYPFTAASISSTMNFVYLQDVFGEEFRSTADFSPLRNLVHNSRSVRMLQEAGYTAVSFSSEYTEARVGPVDSNVAEWWFPSQFAIGLANMTPFVSAFRALGYPFLYDLHRYRTTYPFHEIHQAFDVKGPKFVYGHSFFAHPPFVFDKDGGKQVETSWDYTWDDGGKLLGEDSDERLRYVQNYVNQVTYLNGELLAAIDEILANSERPPIIVLQGDHGSGSKFGGELQNTDLRERFSIFYAVLLPDGGEADLYPSISPVNGFRVIFNRYFGADFPLLEDASYFASHPAPYAYTPVDEQNLRVAQSAIVRPNLRRYVFRDEPRIVGSVSSV